MRHEKPKCCRWLFLVGFWLLSVHSAASLATSQLGVGSKLPVLGFEDQFGQAHQVDGRAQVILFLPDRAASKIARKALKGRGQNTLTQRGIVGIADISGMPSLFTDMFALPKLREQPWSLLLGRTAEDTFLFPRQPETVTLIRLRTGEVTALEYFQDKKSLRAALNL